MLALEFVPSLFSTRDTRFKSSHTDRRYNKKCYRSTRHPSLINFYAIGILYLASGKSSCRPLGIYPFVQMHGDGLMMEDDPIKQALHVSMRTQGFLNVTAGTGTGHQLNRAEPIDVSRRTEHESHDS